jgi:hypothetical protein
MAPLTCSDYEVVVKRQLLVHGVKLAVARSGVRLLSGAPRCGSRLLYHVQDAADVVFGHGVGLNHGEVRLVAIFI